MYTRPRQSHDPIPCFSTVSPYQPASHIRVDKTDELPNWYATTDTFLRPDPSTPQIPTPPYHHALPPFPPPPLHSLPIFSKAETKEETFIQSAIRKVVPTIIKTHRTPHLPAEKNSAQRAAKIASECEDLGPDTSQRFKCHFQGCNKYFQRRYNLKVHVRKHTKETPYTCGEPGCGKKFMWRSSISHHLKAHKKRSKKVSQGNATSPREGAQEARADGSPLAPLQPMPTLNTSGGYKGNVDYGPVAKGEDRVRRAHGRLLPTSPISSGTNERLGSFGLEHVEMAGGGDVGMEELNFHGEQVAGMMFDNIM